jgi:hypothetical protein
MVRLASSLVSTVDAAAVTMLLLAGAFDRVTVIVSSDSTVESPLMLTTMVALVWPSAKLTVPVAPGRRPGRCRWRSRWCR